MIKLQIIGNLGKDCIVKEVNGKNVINFSVAHTERFKDAQGNQKERTTWVECAYWTDRTAVAQYLTKGRTVYAEGSPEADAYTNKEGQVSSTLRMRVQTVQLLGGNSPEGSGSNAGNVSNAGISKGPVAISAPAGTTEGADDLPF
ncbi:MAG: single-stranded DNA-binding protein [Sphingobacteriales bacterium]|jgi:single-strand DNA-binding protein|nr:single-stranded DNA-binding protein [Sphingobacteriales bacterium]